MTKRRLKIMRRAYSRPSLKVSPRTVLRNGNITGTVLFNQVGITLKDATRPMMKNNARYFPDRPRIVSNFPCVVYHSDFQKNMDDGQSRNQSKRLMSKYTISLIFQLNYDQKTFFNFSSIFQKFQVTDKYVFYRN